MSSSKSNLVFVFPILIVLLAGLILWSFSAAFEKSTKSFVDQITLNILTQSSQQITTLVQSAEEVVEFNNDVLKMNTISFSQDEDENAIRQFLKANVVNLGVLKNIGLVKTETKHFFMSYINDDGDLTTREIKVGDEDYRWERHWQDQRIWAGDNVDARGAWESSNYHVEHRLWYREAVQQNAEVDFELVWTGPYVFEQSGEVGFTCAKAINEPGIGYRSPFAVAFADISLDGASQVLQRLDIGAGSFLMLVDERDRVLASSLSSQKQLQSVNGTLPTVTSLGSHILDESVWQDLKESAGPGSSRTGVDSIHSFSHNGVEFFARAMPLEKEVLKHFGWSLWVFVPQEALLEGYQASLQRACLIAGLFLFLSLFISLLVRSRT